MKVVIDEDGNFKNNPGYAVFPLEHLKEELWLLSPLV